MQSVAVLRCYGSPDYSDSSLALLGLVSHIFFFTIPHVEVRPGPFVWSIMHGDTLVLKPGIDTFGSYCWRKQVACPYSWTAEGSVKCSKTSWWTVALTLDLINQWTNSSRWPGSHNPTLTEETLHLISNILDSVPLLSSSSSFCP